jgi:peroxiredoxin
LTDKDRELALNYGAASNKNQFFASRVTVVLDDKGEWILFYPTGKLGPLYKHAQMVLDDLAILLP